MQQVEFGRTGLKVSAACLGAGGYSRLGRANGATFHQSVAVVKRAIDLGITMIDTAAKYGTEPVVGAAIKGVRDKVVISTKAAIVRDSKPDSFGEGLITGDEFIRLVDEGLVRLGTDYVDVMHLHGVGLEQYNHCRDELVPAFFKLREAGKVRFFGITERFNVDTAHEMLKAAVQDDVWDVMMVGYNFLNQTAAAELLVQSQRARIATMCMYAVRGGLVDSRRAEELVRHLIETGEVDAGAIDPTAPFSFLREDDSRLIPTAEAGYRFCRHTPGIDVVMTGTGNLDHLAENIRSIEAPALPPKVLAELQRLFGRVFSISGNPLGAGTPG